PRKGSICCHEAPRGAWRRQCTGAKPSSAWELPCQGRGARSGSSRSHRRCTVRESFQSWSIDAGRPRSSWSKCLEPANVNVCGSDESSLARGTVCVCVSKEVCAGTNTPQESVSRPTPPRIRIQYSLAWPEARLGDQMLKLTRGPNG